jgi:XTP/dITP diphosphohydrolase
VTDASLLLATRSEGKLRELRQQFAGSGLEVTDLVALGVAPEPIEDELEVADTFEENALAKARYFFDLLGRPVVADDSGLEVAALGGRPGVRSKRWSGRTELAGQALDDANNIRLLAELAGRHDRRAQYVCCAAYVERPSEIIRRGEVRGEITLVPRGAGGFGYDPYFFSPELGKTFGEATPIEKESVSHRGRAFRELIAAILERR